MRFAKGFLTFIGVVLFTQAAWAKIDTVRMTDFAFVPASVTISLGDTIVWKSTQQCCIVHTTTRSAGPMTWDATVPLNTTFQLVFGQAGMFNYECTPHAGIGMTGSIVVQQSTPSLGWAGLALLLSSLGSAGAWLLQRRKAGFHGAFRES
jgi:plastocyanin